MQPGEDPLRRRRQLVDHHAGRLVDGVQDRRDGRHDTALANLLGTEGTVRLIERDDEHEIIIIDLLFTVLFYFI